MVQTMDFEEDTFVTPDFCNQSSTLLVRCINVPFNNSLRIQLLSGGLALFHLATQVFTVPLDIVTMLMRKVKCQEDFLKERVQLQVKRKRKEGEG